MSLLSARQVSIDKISMVDSSKNPRHSIRLLGATSVKTYSIVREKGLPKEEVSLKDCLLIVDRPDSNGPVQRLSR